MSTTTRIIRAEVNTVWDVLTDGWTYPLWVVGAARVRDVDDTWPAVGSRIMHSVGAWPLLLDDTTTVAAVELEERLSLTARGWPAGEASVVITTRARGRATSVSITEDATAGPGRLVPAPVRHLGIGWRNIETLRRLALLAENRPDATQPGPTVGGR
ncbi:SRPBCC family protein [Solicola sp. PLA-1-18]|uniref:SRPBCC family protein n=1 Tax=Solicola sp. PLA-1-18 TaxID=3380532 RepID=UPI003B7B01C8